ncbi:MAG: HAMP domain-containing histidine kinase [Anaerolineae bacterium]|nr:HAMP domain-containing histidine kinase [Anaerolineae bacterium]
MRHLLPTRRTSVLVDDPDGRSPPVGVQVQERTAVTLNVGNVAPGAFTEEHADAVSLVAMSLTTALQAAQLYAAAQQELANREAVERALRESEQQLQTKAAELVLANRELDTFARTVAHDLKAPLSLLMGYADLIEEDRLELGDIPEKLGLYLGAIGRATYKMNRIVDELLLLASMHRPGDIPCGPVDMAAIISDVLWRLSNVIRRRQATITLPEVWPIAVGYGPWIEEVWANYLSNALKYGGDPPLIALGASVVEGNPTNGGPPLIRFWVRDCGKGLSLVEQKRIFTPFERLDQVRVEGHGLGLSIVRRIMARLGGEAGVESAGKAGKGSLFYFTLAGQL